MKKRYVLNVGDQQHQAVVARRGSETRVGVNDEPPAPVNYHPVLGGRAISLRYGGRLHLIHLTGLDASGRLAASLAGRSLTMTVMDELKAQALESLGTAAGSGTISADIPGLVIEIKVALGQKVHQGEPVVVVEAMKMQNELAAAVTGTVSAIPVTTGQTVNPGDVLVVIEPEAGG